MREEPLVIAVTLNWNRPQDTIACLHTLQKQTYRNLQLIVVDNGSTDNSVPLIKEAVPAITLLETHENLGFAAGMNVGIRFAVDHDADYVFILNNDTLLAPDAVENLLFYGRKEVCMTAPIIFYADDPQLIWSQGAKKHSLLLEIIGDKRGTRLHKELPDRVSQDFVPGCAMFFPNQLLREVGLFDEAFFMYYEDADLCMRIKAKGVPIFVVPKAKMWHKVSLSSGGTDSTNERYWMARSSIRYFSKHSRWWQRPFILFWRTGSAIRTTWRLLRKNRGDALGAYWRGLWHGIKDVTQSVLR